MYNKNIILIGGGGHCRSVIDVIELEGKYKIAGIIDKKELIGSEVLGYKVIGCDDDLINLREEFCNALVTIGHIKTNELRKNLFNYLVKLGFSMPSIVSPLSYVAKGASIGEGSVVMHQCLVNSNVTVGQNSIINTKALIEHDAVIEDNTHISTGVIINGGTVVKEDSFVGSGCITKEYIEVSGFIKAGSILK